MDRRAFLAVAGVSLIAGCSTDGANTSDRTDANDSPTPPAVHGGVTRPSGVVEPGTVDDFTDLARWTVTGGTVTADEDRALLGGQSGRIETDADEGTTTLSFTFDEPIDCADVAPGLALASTDVVVPWLTLVDADGNRLAYRRGVRGDLPLDRYNFGVDTVDDGFDPTDVETVELRLWTGEGESRTVWVDDLHFVPRPETGAVMIQFDDTYRTDYTEALPILEEYGYEAVTFINPGYVGREVGGSERLTERELDVLADAGWCLSNHTDTHPHLADLDVKAQEREICDGKEWLEARGYDEGAQYFAYPFGSYDERTLDLVERHHEIGFAGGYPVQGYTANPVLASRISEPDRTRAKREFERTATFPGITCFFFHELTEAHLADFEATIEVLHEYESAGEIDVILPQDLERDYLF